MLPSTCHLSSPAGQYELQLFLRLFAVDELEPTGCILNLRLLRDRSRCKTVDKLASHRFRHALIGARLSVISRQLASVHGEVKSRPVIGLF